MYANPFDSRVTLSRIIVTLSISPYFVNSSRKSSSLRPFGTITNNRTYFSCSLSDRPDP